jgi:hypothetical protein
MNGDAASARDYYEKTSVSISDIDRHMIYSEMGWPVVSPEDLEIGPDDVDEVVLRPALMDYFSYFPIKTVQEVEVNSDYSIPFPNPTTVSVIDARIVPNSGVANVPTLSPFMNERNWSIAAGGLFGQGQYDMEMMEAKMMNRKYIQATQNLLVAKLVHIDRNNRTLTGFMNAPAVLRITWADYSLNVDDVDFQKRRDLIKLAKAYLLRTIAMIRGQQNSNTGMDFNTDALNTRAEKLEEESLGRWKAFAKPIVLRG